MSVDVRHLIDLAALTLAYWLVDHAIRGERLVAIAHWLGLPRNGVLVAAVLPALGLASALPWSSIAPLSFAGPLSFAAPSSFAAPWAGGELSDAVRLMSAGIATFLAWKASTKDIDVVLGQAHRWERGALVFAAIGSWFSPVFVPLAALLLTTPFGLWEHHSTLPMRVLQSVVAHLAMVVVAALANATLGAAIHPDGVALVFFIVTIQIAHYLITALAKGWLGPHWYSWPLDNRVHHLAASAYSWGWARFLPWSTWIRVIRGVKIIERPMQIAAFSIELLAPLALLDARLAIAFSLGWSFFHFGVFLLSGLLFWDWIATNLCIAVAISLLPESLTSQIFGGGAVLVSLAFMVAFPLRHKLYKPMPLGWWDTPFTQRIHWIGHGKSGTLYGIYNSFMCPHERLYGKVHGCFLAPSPVMTYHLGEVWKHQLRDALRAAGPSSARLDRVREQYGIQPRDASMTERHVAYLRRFFVRVNQGATKSVLPSWLRWIKAPGDQIFYWGELPSYVGQEPLGRVSLRYREEYFDGDRLVRLCDDDVLEVEIDELADAGAVCVPEPTPKDIDDLLLQHGKGRLIDLPSFGDGYVKGDDGRRKGSPEPA